MSQGAAPRMHLKLPRLGVLRLRQWPGFTRGHHPSLHPKRSLHQSKPSPLHDQVFAPRTAWSGPRKPLERSSQSKNPIAWDTSFEATIA